MALAYVKSTIFSSPSSSSANPMMASVTNGNLLVVGIGTSGSGTSVSSISDGANTYVKVSGRTFLAGNGGSEIWAAYNVSGGNLTVLVTFSGSVSNDVVVAEYSSAATSPFDVQATTTGTSTTPSSGSATTNQANELIVGVFTHGSSTFTAGTGFTLRQSGPLNTRYEDRIVSSSGSYVADGSLAASSGWTACMATFKELVAGLPPGKSRFILQAVNRAGTY